jgi:outer membrane biosynthesis protein TonB
MRVSLTISLALHAAILACALIVLPNPEEFKVEDQESIPIDIVSIEDVGKRQASVKTPEKPAEKIAPKPVEVMKEIKPAPEVAPEIKTAAREPSPAEPEPKPEVKKEEPKKEAEPEPKPEEIAELIKKTEEEKPPEKKEEPKKAESKPVKEPEKKPVKKPEKKKPKPKFDTDDIAAFLNKVDDKRTAPQKPQKEEGAPKQAEFNLSGLDDGVAATIADALRQRLSDCWTIPPGAREAQVNIRLRFQLNSDGTVAGAPQVLNSSSDPLFATTAQSAISAVMDCQAYDFLPPDRYDLWRENTVNFNPNLMGST